MDFRILLLLPACLVVTALGVGLMRRVALARGIVDVPNERSSHARAVPRGGGLVIALVAGAAVAALAAAGAVSPDLALALLVAGVAVAAIGYADDLRGVPALVRLGVQSGAALAAAAALGGWGAGWLEGGSAAWWLLQAATVIGIVWFTNLYNFMDGIDGLAGAEAVHLGLGGMFLLWASPGQAGVAAVALVLGATALGFLVWNWPPARIFMGDVGSGFLGMAFAVLALASVREDPQLLAAWLILAASFLVDSGVTLVRRVVRRERLYEAHRIHAYQWLARRFAGHAPVTVLYSAVNVLWLLPMAWLSMRLRDQAAWIAMAAITPLVAAALAAGAGRQERRSRT